MHSPETSHMENKIVETLASLPFVSEFLLGYIRPPLTPTIPLENFRGGQLRKLVIDGSFRVAPPEHDFLDSLSEMLFHNPRISHLELNLHDLTLPSPFQFSDLFRTRPLPHILSVQTLILDGWSFDLTPDVLVHLQYLRRLSLFSGVTIEPECWSNLKKDGVFLRHIHICQLDDEVLDYLESFSGLETLSFNQSFNLGTGTEQSRALAQRFYERVLPRHEDSLRELRVQPYTDAHEWGTGLNNVGFLGGLKQLEVLEISPRVLHEDQAPENRQLMDTLIGLALDLPILQTLHLGQSTVCCRKHLAGMLAETKLPRPCRVPLGRLKIVALPISTVWYIPTATEAGMVLPLNSD
ncbi:hypothetical protein V5O48_005511 [Marasmius crinis-equi]|uniref:Uncharacterized protein n=1 Tax=Marasmius crinis-equi TaxID=585013 RepID=A0ABR3FMH5_9AGAR